MPVFTSGEGLAPDWCEMEFFEIISLKKGQSRSWEKSHPKEKLIVTDGSGTVKADGNQTEVTEGSAIDLDEQSTGAEVTAETNDFRLVRMCGRWSDPTGESGLFAADINTSHTPKGDPTDYEKNTIFDNHYHDSDEYWILLDGKGVAASEGKLYDVSPGDCVATGMGHHHDFPIVHSRIKAVYFETTL